MIGTICRVCICGAGIPIRILAFNHSIDITHLMPTCINGWCAARIQSRKHGTQRWNTLLHSTISNVGLDTEATDRTVRLQSTVWKPPPSYSLGAGAQRLRGLERELDSTRQVRWVLEYVTLRLLIGFATCRPDIYKPCQSETLQKTHDNVLNFMGFMYLHRGVEMLVSLHG